jgi:hypothetical protein
MDEQFCSPFRWNCEPKRLPRNSTQRILFALGLEKYNLRGSATAELLAAQLDGRGAEGETKTDSENLPSSGSEDPNSLSGSSLVKEEPEADNGAADDNEDEKMSKAERDEIVKACIAARRNATGGLKSSSLQAHQASKRSSSPPIVPKSKKKKKDEGQLRFV